MTPERWSDVERLCQAALGLSGERRAVFLAEACAGDDALRREVESILAHETGAKRFLSGPIRGTDVTFSGTSLVGQSLGSYTVQAPLGAGGMGQVYRAHDTKLGRDVAIKILPRVFATDPSRRARFTREAQVLASLNHPHIGAIYGVEEIDGVRALVLELVEGDTLADRIAGVGREPSRAQGLAPGSELPAPGATGLKPNRPLPLDDTLNVALQVVKALEAAHERGIVHRDLKPANIKITPEAVVKVLDFGLAKIGADAALALDVSQAPAGGGTREGLILGTPAYMSPEQARGKAVDKRTDIWAFGCVLYEMLTGRATFIGDTITDILAAIVEREPDWHALPNTTPSAVRRLLQRCLEKDPKRRLQDIGDARLDIEEALSVPSHAVPSPSPVRRWRTRAAWALAAMGSTVMIGGLAAQHFHSAPVGELREVRFTIGLPEKTVLPPVAALALSPDGRRLAFAALRAETPLLWIRSLDALEPQSLSGTEGAGGPIWSPDSRMVAFVADRKLKTIDVGSGSIRTLCEIPMGATGESVLRGGSWSPDSSTIVFAILQGGLFSVPARGGSPTLLANPGAAPGEVRIFPVILPDGRHFVYLSAPSNVAWLGSFDSKEPAVRLLNATSQVEYVDPGYLVFARGETLMAQRFDAQHRRLAGEAVQVADGVMGAGYGSAFSTSLSGALVYRPDPLRFPTQLTWVDRKGHRLGVVGRVERHRNPEISPDGTSAVMQLVDSWSPSPDLWHLDLKRGAMTRLTFNRGSDAYPVWSPDSQWILFSSDRGGAGPQLYRIRPDGSGEERVLQSSTAMVPYYWARDGNLLVYQSRPGFKLGTLSLSTGGPPHLFDDPRFEEAGGQVSPDGRWLAYITPEGGEGTATGDLLRLWNVYVQSFPRPGGKLRISTNGATSPRWSRDGTELFFYAGDGHLMAVPVTTDGEVLKIGVATALFEPALLGGAVPQIGFKQQYDVAKDGSFLLNVPVEQVSDQSLTVVVNWTAALTR